jgi:uncharacterized protein Yka (UPF0111/DUF47 family)
MSRSGSVSKVLRELAGRPGVDLVEVVSEQLRATIEGARLVQAAIVGEVDLEETAGRMERLEHAGDAARAELVRNLSRVLVTPIDREDLFRVSRSVDDVLDNLRDFLREARLFRSERLSACAPLLPPLLDALERLSEAVDDLHLARGDEVNRRSLAARKAGNQIRRSFDEALAALFSEPLGPETLKVRELLRRLDVVGLRIVEATDALADGWLKRHG